VASTWSGRLGCLTRKPSICVSYKHNAKCLEQKEEPSLRKSTENHEWVGNVRT